MAPWVQLFAALLGMAVAAQLLAQAGTALGLPSGLTALLESLALR
jgi:hypothetical protein